MNGNLYAIAILGYVLNGTAKLDLKIRLRAELIKQDAGELRLLALHPVGISRGVRNCAEIKLRQQSVFLGAKLEAWRFQSLRNQRRCDTEAIQHIQCRRVERRGARFLAECGSRLEYGHRHTTVNEIGRGCNADGPGTGTTGIPSATARLTTT